LAKNQNLISFERGELFDANENQQIVREPSGVRTKTTWIYDNQPTLFRMPDGSRVTMTYNANNRRVVRE
jgi:YD repeat-containing protein